MENNTQKNIMFLVLAGVVLVLLNGGIFMAAGKGQLAPIDNLVLWGAFAVLNICSLLWAVSLLGLQPLVVAVSYVAGGTLAFMGVRMLPDINVAEITTAGATYGAFGALAVGNATTRVRLAFFNKAQIPFIFIILALLLLDGLLNSQVSKAGIGVVLNALVIPFIFSGAVVGLVWMLLVRAGIGKNMNSVASVEEGTEAQVEEKETRKPERLVIEVPDRAEAEQTAAREAAQAKKTQEAQQAAALAARKAEQARAMAEKKRMAEETRKLAEQRAEEVRVRAERKAAEEAAAAAAAAKEEAGRIFPLEIDSGETVPSAISDVVPEKVLEIEPEIPAAKSSGGTDDWLNSHMDLLNELTKKAS